ncbi:MAG: N-acetylmuramoyl-L-alanine amidase [Rhodobacterales bacterium]|nr:MAG: N-acetylmuramoyl-L-alanine amidase [Rhodobacterales bacterium]
MTRSPNFGPRRDGLRPSLVVLHYTAMDSFDAARERLCDPAVEVSAHWLIGESGTCTQLVDEEMRAWHAGAGSWGGEEDINSRSIGIELCNTGAHPFPEPQMAALEPLLAAILNRWSIPPQRVIGHSDMAPQRKFDPGPRFDWLRLARQGLSVWAQPGPAHESAPFMESATRFGYTADLPQEAILAAFRARFRPYAAGPESAADRALIGALAALYPAASSSYLS